MTTDFLSPYLLYLMDQKQGMMDTLNGILLNYLTWGIYEANIEHRKVCRHVHEFKGS